MTALCKRLGVNYLWGLCNFAVGVACGAFVAGMAAGIFKSLH